MSFKRQLLEGAIERLIDILDKMDDDSDFEPEPLEEQHDAEADLTWRSGTAPLFYIVAEQAQRKAANSR